jgi:phospholipid-binding lipoprotein MlaA
MRPPASLLALASLLAGCASLPPGRSPDPQDPFERYNRAAFSFNDAIDRVILKPVSQAYNAVMPSFVQRGVTNFFGNLSDAPTAVNDLLQGKATMAATHLGRLAINTTFGLLGVLDLATPMGLERQREDFGQTLGRWGLASGPYLVLPILGPSSVRDASALPADFALDPVIHVSDTTWRYSLMATRTVQRRASFLEAEKALTSIELDPYLFMRDAYLSRRRSLVYDGDPPEPQAPPDPADAGTSSKDTPDKK